MFSEYLHIFIFCSSNNKEGHPPSEWSILGILLPIDSISPSLFVLVADVALTNWSKSAEESFGKTPYAFDALYPLGTYKYFNAIYYDVSAASSASDNTSLNTTNCLTCPSI